MSLTGKQRKFVTEYLNGANFNATAAAQRAGYKATKKHTFESIGSENLQKPAIKQAIDEFFAGAEVSAEETLRELSKLARGDSKDKVRALALLASHHGLLDGSWRSGQLEKETERRVEQRVQQQWNEFTRDLEKDVNDLNRKGLDIFNQAKARFKDKPDVMAFCDYYSAILEGKELQEPKEPAPVPEVEIIPPARRLEPAPIERMMQQVSEPIEPDEVLPPEPVRCRHGALPGECRTFEIGRDYCPHWYAKTQQTTGKGIYYS